jgi:hypothetical protein
MAVALVVLLGSLSSLLVGSRIAEHRTVEERLARWQIETLMAGNPGDCPALPQQVIDNVPYNIATKCPLKNGYVELTVTVTVLHSSDPGESLTIDRVAP